MTAVQGSLDTLQLPEILQLLSEQHKSGILTVQGQGDILAISFLQGRIVGADALSEPIEEGLGEILIADGLLERRDLARYVSRQRAGEGQLIDLLISDGRLERRQVLDALRRQTLEMLVKVLAWRQGDFKFYGGDEVSHEEGFRPLRVDEVLLAGLPEGDEAADPAAATRRYRRTEPRRNVELVTELDQSLVGRDDPDTVWLTPQEAEFYRRVTPEKTTTELAGELGVDGERAAFLAFDLERRGLISAVAEPAAPLGPADYASPEPPAFEPSAPAIEPIAPLVPDAAPAPAPAAPEPEETAPAAAPAARRELPPWAATGLAAALLAALAAAVGVGWAAAPGVLLLPFPWLDETREAYAADRERVSQLAVDQAAKTVFLLEGRFPDRLERLVAEGLLAPEEPGRYLYAPSELAYALQRVDPRGVAVGARVSEGVSGNFLLDPEFFAPAPEEEEAPLVLLD